jgi:hypothetical protein
MYDIKLLPPLLFQTMDLGHCLPTLLISQMPTRTPPVTTTTKATTLIHFFLIYVVSRKAIQKKTSLDCCKDRHVLCLDCLPAYFRQFHLTGERQNRRRHSIGCPSCQAVLTKTLTRYISGDAVPKQEFVHFSTTFAQTHLEVLHIGHCNTALHEHLYILYQWLVWCDVQCDGHTRYERWLQKNNKPLFVPAGQCANGVTYHSDELVVTSRQKQTRSL